jgi:hypothetical protein
MKYWNFFYQLAVLGLLGCLVFLQITQTQLFMEFVQLMLFLISGGKGG